MRPIHIADVTAQASAADLHITAWLRARQRRLLPIQLDWDEVDNPEAAQLFVDEVQGAPKTRLRRLEKSGITGLLGNMAGRRCHNKPVADRGLTQTGRQNEHANTKSMTDVRSKKGK